MPEVIQDWLGTKLGVLIDMTPERFGRNTKDGTLLAKLLYNYGVIPVHILNNVKESRNYYECYNNLIVLKPWLRYIGVVHDDSTLQKMAGGEGSAAISVFYSVYLTLERKDRLHYISAQKERRATAESCERFKVSWVPEAFIGGEPVDSLSKLAAPIFESAEMVNWHREKCNEVREKIKQEKAKIQRAVKKKTELGPLVSKHASSQPLDKRQIEAEETRQNISAFEKQHPQENPNLTFSELAELQNMYEMQPCFSPSMSEAKNIVSNIKRRKKGDTYAREFQQKMQHILLDEQWGKIIEKQDRDFESKVCENLLKQSQYEKQMAKKLYLIRNQKKVLAENRKKIESLKIDLCQKEYDERVQREMEIRGEYWEDEQLEKERIEELHRRLYDEKARLRREMLKTECRKICEALSDIAIRISEFRELVGCQIPKSVMRDLKELFFKDLPIFDILEHYEDLYVKDSGICVLECPQEEGEEGEGGDEGEAEFYRNRAFSRMKSEELDRQSILDDCDFNDYIQLMGPWMVELLFPDGSEMEVKELVLGYIVHKLLAVKYPSPNAPVPVDVKPMKPKSMIHGLTDEMATNMLIDLMEACGILVVRVDDAINFVLSAYKEELSVVRDIDITFQKVTEDALQQKTSKEKEKEGNRKTQLLKVEYPEKSVSREEFSTMEKETQTPRMIPEDDPLLSPNAEFGKQAFEALGAGDPVPDHVIASAIVAYVLSKQDYYDGWVLLNYPLLYSQASDLEYFLTGYRTLPLMEEAETLEDMEGFTYRGPWGNSFRDDFGEDRVSKLVPRPDIFVASNVEIPKTYFDSFIKLRKNPGTPRRRSLDLSEFGPMEKFYSDLDVLTSIEYQTLNFQTVKNLGKHILRVTLSDDQADTDVEKKASVEIFGSVVLELNEKWDPKKKNGKEVQGGSKNVSKERKSFPEHNVETEEEGEGLEEVSEYKAEVESSPPNPGDPTWEWATGNQPEEFLVALASLWENMEAVYIEDFKNVFFCLRVHRFNVANYCGFMRKSMRILMRRPDEKQKVLSEFQQMFNEIDEDLRPEIDIKCELHVRVSELEEALMSIADERKSNSLKDATKVAQDGWVPDEMAYVVNTFLTALQLEADRAIDSAQVIMDYYISLQQKLPDARSLGKITVPKLQVQDRKYSVSSSNKTGSFLSPRNTDPRRSMKSMSESSGKFGQEKMSKTRSLGDKKRRSSESGLASASEFITDILTNLSLPEDGLTPFHIFFMDTVQLVTNDVKNTLEGCIFEAKKTDKVIPTTTRQTKTSKKPSETNIMPSNENLFAEWLTALENELSRFTFRSQLILSRGIFDMNEFLTMILNILSSLTEDITEMYLKEIKSISECCKVFRCGIEKEVEIRPRLELKEDEFIVHMDNIACSNEDVNLNVEDERERFSFTIEQLNLLFHKLQRIAPDGEIIKRSLVYIFEDLRMLNPEVEDCKCFPEIWNDIQPDDVTTIMNEVYQDLEIVHWKDFIIYALELPLPTEVEILTMRHLFRKFDPLVTELITKENYKCITLWFERPSEEIEMEKNRQAKDLLYQMYQVNELQTNYSALLLAFCKDEDPVVGFEKALALAMGKPIKKYEESSGDSLMGEMQSYGFDLFDETSRESSRKPVCCPTSSTEATVKCIPKEKIVRCECKDERESSFEKMSENLENPYPENVEETGEAEEGLFCYGSKESTETSFIPFNILSSLLKASFPSLPQLSILLDCQHTFQETLNAIYDSFESYDNTLEVHKLLNHKFINRLLHTTNKFKFVKLKPVLLSVAKVKPPMPRVLCITEKPNVSFCLRN